MFTRIKKLLILILGLMIFNHELFCFENRAFEQVLESNYANCKLEKENVFLTKQQVEKIQSEIDQKVSSLVLRYKNKCNDNFIYIDSHFVRTQNETVVIEVGKDKIIQMEIASFMEPKEYLPPPKWIELFLKKGKEVDALTGATLSQHAIMNVAKKYLLLNRVLNE